MPNKQARNSAQIKCRGPGSCGNFRKKWVGNRASLRKNSPLVAVCFAFQQAQTLRISRTG